MNSQSVRHLGLVTFMGLMGCATTTASSFGIDSPAQRRLDLLQLEPAETSSQTQLVEALSDTDVLVRRTAARRLAQAPTTPSDVLAQTLDNEDVLVRRTGLAAIFRRGGNGVLDAAERALVDPSVLVRLAAVQYLAAARPHSERVLSLLHQAGADRDDKIREIATRATWPFYRLSTSIRDQQMTDVDLKVTEAIPLPVDGWHFQMDPLRQGHRLNWYDPLFDDEGWDVIAIEQVWQEAGYDYTGVSWYRNTIDLPQKPDHRGVDLAFGGVDESTWVWVNGEYVGDHDIGPAGWNVSFRLDVTPFLRRGEPNQITVRAMNTAHAGGIWRPVSIEVLK